MNKFLNGLKDTANIGYTENGATKRLSTGSNVYDMFAMGAAMRTRSDEDICLMFQKAFKEDPIYALKCLFYIRDVRGGQGERRFFRTVITYMANNGMADAIKRNLQYIPEYGRWDDLYAFAGTPLQFDALEFMKKQFVLDLNCKTPSLLAKWLKSENTSSVESRILGDMTRRHFGMTHKQYRKTLSMLRKRINVLERLMSDGRWDEIEFDKIPSRAGMIYKNAFARHDLERLQLNDQVQSYADFAKDKTSKVNAKALYPYECVAEAFKVMGKYWGYGSNPYRVSLNDTQRLIANKYWDNLANYFNDATFNGMAIVDTSGSMCGSGAAAPINVAISLGLYCAEKAKGPFAGNFMTFSNNPTFIPVEGVDFCDKVARMSQADWGGSTNIEAAFDLMLKTAVKNRCSQDEIPETLIVISDMEFNSCVTSGPVSYSRWGNNYGTTPNDTLFESMSKKWMRYGYEMPRLIFWNVQARHSNIPMRDNGRVTYISGMSPSIFESVMTGKTGMDLMYDKLNSERYKVIK